MDGLKSIQGLFFQRKFRIPAYQRQFVWSSLKNGEIPTFWDDLKDVSHDKNSSRYLFGSMIIRKTEDGYSDIIDGQQRLTTITIFLAAARNVLKEIAFKNNEIVCNDAYNIITYKINPWIGRVADNSSEDALVLNVPSENAIFFRNNIQQQVSHIDNGHNDSTVKMAKAYNFFYKGIKNEVLGGRAEYSHKPDEATVVDRYIDTLIEKYVVFYIETSELREAYITFETLNSRGTKLSAADLLKNYFYSKCNPQGDNHIIENVWAEMTRNIGDSEKVSQYIRYFWISEKDKVSEAQLFKSISKDKTDPIEIEEMAKELEKYSKLFSSVINPKKDDYFNNGEIVATLDALKVMNFTIFTPLLISMERKKYTRNDIRSVLKKIEILVFKNVTICNHRTNTIETIILSLSREIYKNRMSVESIIDALCSEMVEEEDFRKKLKGRKYKDNELPKYILRDLYNTDEYVMKNELHLEHILPLSKRCLSKDWKHITPEQQKEYVYNIGNMTLLHEKLNKPAQDRGIGTKKQYYSRSDILDNKDLSIKGSWNIGDIEIREEMLIDRITEHWN